MSKEIHCATCNRPMQAGFMLDHGHLNSRTPALWVEGEPKASFWSGLSLSGKMAYEVQSFRCPRCGRLEFFANRPAGT
jgi:phage FluMu protein Com